MLTIGLLLADQDIKSIVKNEFKEACQFVELNENNWQQNAANLTLAIVEADKRNWSQKLKETGCPRIFALTKEEALARLELNFVDDFIVYPFKPQELKARLSRLLRSQETTNKLQVEDLIIDTDKYEVLVGGESLELTFKEYELLKFLVEHAERVWSRQALLNRIWEYDYFGGTRTVDVHIRRLRAKLGPKYSEYLQTVRHVGYKWAKP